MAISLIAPRDDDPYRVAIAGSVRCNCARCSHVVIVSPASLIAAAGQETTILCVQCAAAQHTRTGVKFQSLPWTDAQKREFLVAIGKNRPS